MVRGICGMLAMCVGMFAGWALGADEAKKDEAAKPESVMTEMRIQRIAGPTILYTETETTMAKIGEIATKTLGEIEKAAANKVGMTGPAIFVYQGAMGQADQPFKVTIGYMVSESAKGVGEYKVKKLADFRCATVIYSGPMAKIGDAYRKLFGSLMAGGNVPTGETREYYLYWEGAESPNNIVQLQAGIR